MSILSDKRPENLEAMLKHWPIEKIKSLTLSEYALSGSKETFIYDLEFGIARSLGSIRGGDSSKFGIYERKNAPKGERPFIIVGEHYSWKKNMVLLSKRLSKQ